MTIAARSPALDVSEQPTRIRWRIVALIVLISTVTYLDRVNVSIAAAQIMHEHGLSPAAMGRVFSAFILAYALFQLPGGWLGDRFGPRLTLGVAILWWSLFTALTAFATRIAPLAWLPPVAALCIVRFSMGMGEAAAFPNFNRTIANWVAPQERGFASSLALAGGGLGACATPPLIAWMIGAYGWREAFCVCAGLGGVASVIWISYVRDSAEQHPGVNALELRTIRGSNTGVALGERTRQRTPWRALLSTRSVWLLTLLNFACGYVTYIYLTWFYTYLVQVRWLSVIRGSIYAIGPFLAITLMTPLGGAICDYAARRLGTRLGRMLPGMGGMLIAGMALIAGARTANINYAIVWLSIGAGAIFVSFAAQCVVTIDICKAHAGVISGIMNFGGNAGGFISPMLMPFLAQRWGWTPALVSAAALLLVVSSLWLILQPERAIEIGTV